MSLPAGFAVRLHDDVRAADGGRVLVGGSPLRAITLSPRARGLVRSGRILVDGAASVALADRLLAANLAVPVLRSRDRAPAGELTVIVPVRDRIWQLYRTLAALDPVSVIVVDDASRDAAGIARVAREHGAEVVRLASNAGPAAARNAGLARAGTPYVAFVDSDVLVSAETLLGLTAHFADDRVALVAPHVRARAVSVRPRWFERYEESAPALGLGGRACVVGPRAAVGWLPSACLVGRADRVAAVGGFDETMRVGEDVDLVWRLTAAGQRVRYDPAFEARHDARPTLRAWAGRKFFYGTGGAALAQRHPDALVTAVLSPSMGVGALALLARRRWSVPVALACAARGAQVLRGALPDAPERGRLAAHLAAGGLWWAVRQEAALVLRHWWPAAAGAALVSRRARRVVASALVVDVVAAAMEDPERNPLLTFAGRRLDDVAYGSGLWWGALRAGDPRCLKIRLARGGRKQTRSCRGT